MVALRVMTAQELLQYSHEPYRTELIGGMLVEMEPAGALHGLVAGRIYRLLANHVAAHGLGETFGAETGFILESDPDTVRAPDASFVCRERVEAIGIPDGYWPGAPDVAFEVASPGDRRREVESKTRAWLDAGTRAVVLIDPRRRSVTVHRPSGATAHSGPELIDLDDVLPGFAPAVDVVVA